MASEQCGHVGPTGLRCAFKAGHTGGWHSALKPDAFPWLEPAPRRFTVEEAVERLETLLNADGPEVAEFFEICHSFVCTSDIEDALLGLLRRALTEEEATDEGA